MIAPIQATDALLEKIRILESKLRTANKEAERLKASVVKIKEAKERAEEDKRQEQYETTRVRNELNSWIRKYDELFKYKENPNGVFER